MLVPSTPCRSCSARRRCRRSWRRCAIDCSRRYAGECVVALVVGVEPLPRSAGRAIVAHPRSTAIVTACSALSCQDLHRATRSSSWKSSTPGGPKSVSTDSYVRRRLSSEGALEGACEAVWHVRDALARGGANS
eukprot:978233-Pyramimonas_sp.AAC.1